MSEPITELIDIGTTPMKKQPKPVREMSQAAISSFFYGSLQLFFTSVASVIVFSLGEILKAIQTFLPTGLTGVTATAGPDTKGGTGSIDAAGIAEMVKELGIATGNSVAQNPTAVPTVPAIPAGVVPNVPAGTGTPNLTTLIPQSTPFQIVPMEVFMIFMTSGFGFLAILTALIAFRAVAKGKAGRGLAITGLMSGLLSFAIAFTVAWVI